MRETYRSPLFRCLVCLVLVCCILVNLSPVRAEALPISTWVWLEASMVFASLFSGLGVSPVDELAAGFRETCDACWDFISLNYDFVTDDEKIAVWATGTDEMPFMIDQELVETVRDWLFSSETLVEEESSSGKLYYNGFLLPDFTLNVDSNYSHYVYRFIVYNSYNSRYTLYACSALPFVNYSSSLGCNCIYASGVSFYASSTSSQWNGGTSVSEGNGIGLTAPLSIIWSSHDLYTDDGSFVFLGSQPSDTQTITYDNKNLLLNYVAPSEMDFLTGYSTWAAGAISVPGIRSKEEEKEVVVPLSIPGTAADVYSFAQTDVWTGANTAADVIAQAVPITGSDPDLPDIPVTPEIPGELEAYTFNLRDFFPFCIPFDLYDFFSVLHAPPEAPKFHWDIQDTSGRTYSIDVDLSSWDNVASFFRKLQLFLFITGLAAASRKYIKW